MNVGSLFSGIGGFDLGLERAGFTTSWFCEQDEFCQRVLARHWPGVPCYPDVTELRGENVEPVEVLCGGFPCQPVSVGGHQRTELDPRWLWPEFARIIRELGPRYVLLENVPGLLERGLGLVLGSLADLGYDAEWDCISAATFGLPHVRERVWIVAYPRGDGRHLSGARQAGDEGQTRTLHLAPSELGGAHHPITTQGDSEPRQDHHSPLVLRGGFGERPGCAPEPGVDRVVARFPEGVDRVRALGNALVPQIAEWIGGRVMAYENERVAA